MKSRFNLAVISYCSPLAFVLVCSLSIYFLGFCVPEASAQQTQSVEAPDRKFVFIEDQDKAKLKKYKKRQKEIDEKMARLQARRQANLPFDISATNIQYDSANKTVVGKGGVIVGYPTGVIEADEIKFNTETEDTEISGDVRIDDLTADIIADKARFNLKSGKGSMENAQVRVAEGGYTIDAAHVEKGEGPTFNFKDLSLSTCKCPEGDSCLPWRITGTSGSITRNGYGQVWNGLFRSYGVPVLYSPYVIFPAKTEMQSGFLPATFGESKRRGFSLFIPFYLALSRSMEATISGVYQEKVRTGSQLDYRGLLSRDHRLDLGAVYLNESRRNGQLLGTNVDGLYDPSFEENRFGGYLVYYNKGSILHTPVQAFADAHYANDDLLVREYSYDDIGAENTRFLTSDFSVRFMPMGNWVGEVLTEFNQSMVTNDDFVFQKLPAAQLSGLEKFRIFGENSYGFKLVADSRLTSTNYDRVKSYDGTKSELYENWKVPFYYGNIFEGSVFTDIRATKYSLGETQDISETVSQDADGNSVSTFEVTKTLPDSSERLLPGFGGSISTVVERVYDVGDGNPVKTLADLGPSARQQGLQRLKHTVQPLIKYRLIPDVDQEDNPLFETTDRLNQTNVVTFQLNQRLFGRFEKRDKYLYGIEESAPTMEEAGFLESSGRIDRRFSSGLRDRDLAVPVFLTVPPTELMNFSITQSLDVLEQQKDRNAERGSWSDMAMALTLVPNSHFRFGGGANYSHDNNDFTDFNARAQLQDKLGDELRARLIFRQNLETQLETSVQINVIEWAKVGYYSRYDDLTKSFIESRLGLRLHGSCNCWILDLDAHDRSNPDETLFSAKITFLGLGSFGNTLFTEQGLRFLDPNSASR